jgi:hypothetical protein
MRRAGVIVKSAKIDAVKPVCVPVLPYSDQHKKLLKSATGSGIVLPHSPISGLSGSGVDRFPIRAIFS